MLSKNTRLSRSLLAAASAIAITAGLFGAIASASAAEAPSVKVSYADLDLHRPADVRVLYQRLQRAANEVCGKLPEMDISRLRAYQLCERSAMEIAIRQIPSPELMAYDRARNGRAS